MKNELTHTATPWSYQLDRENGKRGGDKSTLFLFFSPWPSVRFINLPPTPQMEANTDFIVRAANSHDALVDALKAIIKWDDCGCAPSKKSIEKARAALQLTGKK